MAKVEYNNLFKGLYIIKRNEGFFGLYKGLIPALLREGTYSTLRVNIFTLFNIIRNLKFSEKKLKKMV